MKIIALVFIFILTTSISVSAHEGHDHSAAPGTDAGGAASHVKLSDTAITNLGIQVVKASIAPHSSTIDMNGIIEFLPEKQSQVTSRMNGKVTEIYAKVGQKVAKGQQLLKIQPLIITTEPVIITSTSDGYVIKQPIVVGQSVTPDITLMEIADPSEVLVRGIMYETPDVAKIKVGQKVQVAIPLSPDKPMTGTVQRMDGAFDRGSRTFNVYALVENPERLLLGNMQVLMSLETGEPIDVITVPNRAILGESGEYFVFVKNGNDFERRTIVLGQKFGSEREILEGVFPDEEVVILGNYQLQFAKPADPKKEEKHEDK